MNMTNLINKMVFLSYASPDRDRVIPFYDFLLSKGFTPWMDTKELLPGQNWEFEIRKAIDSAFLIVIFISANSVNRTGYVQKELRIALNKLQERPFNHIYLVPVILDRNVSIPHQLADLQCLYANLPDCNDRLNQALNYQLNQIELKTTESKIECSFELIKDSWDGFPGYDIELYWPNYSSIQFPQVAQASDIIKGALLSSASVWRRCKLEQMLDEYSSAKSKFIRTNLFHTDCREPIIQGSVLSQHIVRHWYGAGAAHSNINIRTWCFLLEPFISIESLDGCFTKQDEALSIIQTEIREQLFHNFNINSELSEADDENTYWKDWIERGTSEWSSFEVFTFEEEHLAFSFDPYQVGSYAEGPQFAQISYDRLIPYMDRFLLESLGLK